MTGQFAWRSAIVAMALFGPSACGQFTTRPLAVTHGWVRLAANPAAPAVAYFTVEAGHAPDALTGVSTDAAGKAEMHETMTMGPNRMTGMSPIARVPFQAGDDVAFAPGGRHVMLFDLAPGVKAGGRVTLSFTFGSGSLLSAPMTVVGAGDPAPF